MLAFTFYLDKNSGWVTDYDGYAEFPEDYQSCNQSVDRPCGYGGVIWSLTIYYFRMRRL